MAEKLVLTFSDASGLKRNWNFNYANQSATKAEIKALMEGMITNGTIYKYPPVQAISAKIVKTTEISYNLD